MYIISLDQGTHGGGGMLNYINVLGAQLPGRIPKYITPDPKEEVSKPAYSSVA